MVKLMAGAILLSVLAVSMLRLHVHANPPAAAAKALRSPSAFDGIADKTARSRALFTEAGKVLLDARCLNCHPAGDQPSQGDALAPHLPAVVRGADGHGAIGLRCDSCHQTENYAPSGVPGNPRWAVAPIEMAWQGRSLGAICAQIKDPARNGGKSLEQMHEHMAHDDLVGWAWAPGGNRRPAPGTQAQLGALIGAWIQTGAECPQP
jgi:hypothetical protein